MREKNSGASTRLLSQIGVGGAVAAVLLYVVFNFLIQAGIVEPVPAPIVNTDPRVDRVHTQVNDLHRWHNITDADGVKLWYVPRSWERAIRSQTIAINEQTALIKEMRNEIRAMRRLAEEADGAPRQPKEDYESVELSFPPRVYAPRNSRGRCPFDVFKARREACRRMS
jgi:hypothetical protein